MKFLRTLFVFLVLCATVTNWAVPFRKKMKSFIFSKEHRGAYLCPTFIEGGALSSNTVLIAFEGFNLFSIFFLPI